MYIRIGEETTICVNEIIAILDLENSTGGNIMQEFMKKAEQDKKIVNDARDLPRAMIITEKKIYISGISALLLQRRANSIASRKFRGREGDEKYAGTKI